MKTIEIPKHIELVLKKLHDNGFSAYMVGGCVRDSLLGKAPQDYDISTSALPEDILRVFSSHATYPLGIAHGTVGVNISPKSDSKPQIIEITTFRIDGTYSDLRRPDSVTFTSDVNFDLSRRDFTINAMAYNAREGLLDPYGGQADLDAGIIRCVGNAHDRLREDALRVMRALRFSAALGFELESTTSQAIKDCAKGLQRVSAERINVELCKLIMGDNAAKVLKEYSDVIAVILPELAPMMGFSQHNPYHNRDVYTHSVDAMQSAPKSLNIRLAVLLHDSGKPSSFSVDSTGRGHFYGHAKISAQIALSALKRLRFDNKTIEAVVQLIDKHGIELPPDKRVVRRWLSRLGKQGLYDLLEVMLADNSAKSDLANGTKEKISEIRRVMEEILEQEGVLSLKSLAVNGNDLITLGIKGKEIGEMLNLCLERVTNQEVQNNRLELIELVKNQITLNRK